MIRKSLVSLLTIGVVASVAACGGTPDAPTSPSVSDAAGEASADTGAASATPVESADTAAAPQDSSSPTSEATSSADPVSAGEIPSVVQGKWITVSEGEEARECTDELDNEGVILTIDSTTMSSFAFVFELESVEESDADSIEAVFNYADDSDAPITPSIRLQTQDDWQTFEFVELGTEGQAPAIYSRCA